MTSDKIILWGSLTVVAVSLFGHPVVPWWMMMGLVWVAAFYVSVQEGKAIRSKDEWDERWRRLEEERRQRDAAHPWRQYWGE